MISNLQRNLVLRAVYNNSDSMTDYYHPDAWFECWYIADMPGKRVSERKLRNAAAILPSWIRDLGFEYERDYGRYRLRSGFIPDAAMDIYGGGQRGIQFLVEDSYDSSLDRANGFYKPIPESHEAFMELVEARALKRKADRMEADSHTAKSRRTVSQIKTIMSATAIFDGNGFEVQTPETRVRRILELEEVRQAVKVKGIDWSKEVFQL